MEQEPEIWKPIPGYEGLYEVSSHGRVKSLDKIIDRGSKGFYKRRSLFLKPATKKDGYKRVVLVKNKLKNSFYIHRLVASVFVLKNNHFDFVNHKDNIRSNNYFKNLEWVNNRENNTYRFLNETTSCRLIGVSFRAGFKNPFVSNISINGITKHLGCYPTEEEANQAYLDALKRYNLKNKYATKPPE